jgi:hypothetical protein
MVKVVIPTVVATLAVAFVAGWAFLHPLLGAVGLAAVPRATLERLHASDRAVDALRQRNAQERAELDREFAQRAARHVASTTIAAATVGPPAVAMATMTVEAGRYCERKEALVRDADLLLGTTTAFDRERCFEDAKRESVAILDEVKRTASKAASEALDLSARVGDEAWSKLREAGRQAFESAAVAMDAAVDAAVDKLRDAARALAIR